MTRLVFLDDESIKQCSVWYLLKRGSSFYASSERLIRTAFFCLINSPLTIRKLNDRIGRAERRRRSRENYSAIKSAEFGRRMKLTGVKLVSREPVFNRLTEIFL